MKTFKKLIEGEEEGEVCYFVFLSWTKATLVVVRVWKVHLSASRGAEHDVSKVHTKNG